MTGGTMRGLMLMLAMAPQCFSQTNAGAITGTIFDATNAVVVGAKVTTTNVATNFAQTAVTGAAGSYTVPALVPGTYRVVAQMAGFRPAERGQIVVAASRTVQLDITLALENASAEISVTADVPLVQQANAAIQYSINQKSLDELPMQSQSVLRILDTLPGVVGEAGGEDTAATLGNTMPGTTISIAGGRMGATQYQADGVSNTSSYYGRISLAFSADSVQEVQVNQNSFSAEYGRVGSGVVNMTTKSGTNDLHGTVFSFIQNDKLNAAPYSNTYRLKNKERMWRGGFNLGGPVTIPKLLNGENRSFFFVGYEPKRQSTGTTRYIRVPTTLEREGDFSQSVYDRRTGYPVTLFRQWEYTPDGQTLSNKRIVPAAGEAYPIFQGARIPRNLISPIAQKILKLMPEPNYINPDISVMANLMAVQSVRNTDNRYIIKFDQLITDANRMSVRFARVPQVGKRSFIGGGLIDSVPWDMSLGTNVAFNDTHTLGTNKVNELRLGFNRSNIARRGNDVHLSKNWFQEFGLPSMLEKGMPDIEFQGGYENPIAGTGDYFIDNTFQLIDIFNWTAGRHSIKSGFEFQAPQQNLTNMNNVQGNWQFNPSGTGLNSGVDTTPYAGVPNASTGNPIATFLLGFPTGISIAPAIVPYQYRWKYYAGFLQDDFKVTPRLTLNLGVRYQVEVPRSEKNHNQGSFVDDFATDSLGQRVRGYIQLSGLGKGPKTIFPTRYNNFEPRFGLAYRLPGSGLKYLKVMRMGYGISHAPTSGGFSTAYPDLNPNSSNVAATGGKDGSFVQIDRNPLVLVNNFRPWPEDGVFADLQRVRNIAAINPNVSIPYVQQWNFGLGFEFDTNTGLEMAYVGSKGTQLFGPSALGNRVDLNQYIPAYNGKLNMDDRFPNPYGLVDASGNVITVTRQSLMRPNPMLGSISDPFSQGFNSIYHSLQLQLVKRYSKGLQANLNYTFAKNIDDISCEGQFCGTNLGNFSTAKPQLFGGNRALERSTSTFDITHVIRYTWNLEMPFGKGKWIGAGAPGWLNGIIGDWKLSGTGFFQGGKPYLAFLGANAGFPEDVGNMRPNYKVGFNGPVSNPGWRNQVNDTTHRYAQLLAPEQMFDPTPRFTVGNVPRTIPHFRTPWTQALNVSLLKDIPIHEKFRVQFRAEAFGVLNHVSFITNVNQNTVFRNLDYQANAIPPIVPSNNVTTGWSDVTPNIGPQRTLQLGIKIYF